MDFFERQEQAHRSTKLLVVYFITGVVLLIAVIYLAVSLFFFAFFRNRFAPSSSKLSGRLWQAVGIGSVEPATALRRRGRNAGGDQHRQRFQNDGTFPGRHVVASMFGARLVNSSTTDPDERKLLNVVEEMALASGMPVPHVYVLEMKMQLTPSPPAIPPAMQLLPLRAAA